MIIFVFKQPEDFHFFQMLLIFTKILNIVYLEGLYGRPLLPTSPSLCNVKLLFLEYCHSDLLTVTKIAQIFLLFRVFSRSVKAVLSELSLPL